MRKYTESRLPIDYLNDHDKFLQIARTGMYAIYGVLGWLKKKFGCLRDKENQFTFSFHLAKNFSTAHYRARLQEVGQV